MHLEDVLKKFSKRLENVFKILLQYALNVSTMQEATRIFLCFPRKFYSEHEGGKS